MLGSGDLVQTLVTHDLVDEYLLAVFSLLLYTGNRLFRRGDQLRPLKLIETKVTQTGGLILTHHPA